MKSEKVASKMFAFGLLINKIATLVDDENLNRIKPSLIALEYELRQLFEEIKEEQ